MSGDDLGPRDADEPGQQRLDGQPWLRLLRRHSGRSRRIT